MQSCYSHNTSWTWCVCRSSLTMRMKLPRAKPVPVTMTGSRWATMEQTLSDSGCTTALSMVCQLFLDSCACEYKHARLTTAVSCKAQPMHQRNKVSFMQHVVSFVPAHCCEGHPQSHASSAHSSIDMAWMIGHYCCCHHTPSGCFQLKLISSLASACAVDSEKMSKSLGNFFTIRDVTAQYHPLVLRWFLLNTQYRQPINYSQPALDEV